MSNLTIAFPAQDSPKQAENSFSKSKKVLKISQKWSSAQKMAASNFGAKTVDKCRIFRRKTGQKCLKRLSQRLKSYPRLYN